MDESSVNLCEKKMNSKHPFVHIFFLCCLGLLLTSLPACSRSSSHEKPISETTTQEQGPTDSAAAEPSSEPLPEPDTPDTSSDATAEPVGDSFADAPDNSPSELEPTEPDAKTPDTNVPDTIVKIGTDEACKTLTKGPFRTVRAGNSKASAPEVLVDHNGYVFKLYPGQSGLFKFDAWRQRDHFLLMSVNVPVEIEDATGTKVPILSSTAMLKQCSGIAIRHRLPFHKVAWYYIRLGPVPKETNVVVTVFDGHLHD